MKTIFQTETNNDLLHSIRWINWIGFLSIGGLLWFVLQRPMERIALFLIILAAVIYNYFLFYRLLNHRYSRTRFSYLAAFAAILIITGFYFILEPYGFQFEVLYILVICSAGILTGQAAATFSVIFAIILYLVVLVLRDQISSAHLLQSGTKVLIMLAAGYWMSLLSGALHENLLLSARRNSYLSLLLKVGTITSRRSELNHILSRICRTISIHLPVSYCAIFLQSQQGNQLDIAGAFPLRPSRNWQIRSHISYSTHEIPRLHRLLVEGDYLVLNEADMAESSLKDLVESFAFDGAKTMGLFPLVARGKSLGLIAVVEVRNWQREPFTDEKKNLLKTLSTQIGSAIENARLLDEAKKRADRLVVLNEVGKAISSTLELGSLLELIHDQLNQVIQTDTYYVGLYDPNGEHLDIRILIDDGEQFPPKRIPLGEGLASWVIQNRSPLLLHHLTQQMDELSIRPIVLGQTQLSESWLGVPMLVGERVLGILGLASYKPDAFNEDDKNLLVSIASQAALAVDNARQHAAVKEQARRDSLTGALNHATFLLSLDQALQQARDQEQTLTLIMLDVDFFKEYNDHHGHQVGDEVLVRIVKTITDLIPPDSFIGRWGGEEFSIALPGYSLLEAESVAHKINDALKESTLIDKNGYPLPAPTLSQGIAAFPQQAQNCPQLVDIADEALYLAKNAGRSQVFVARGTL